MSFPELKQLTRAEELFDAGKLDEAIDILNDRGHFIELNSEQKYYFQLLKGLILFYQNKYDELIGFGEDLFKVGQDLNDNLQSFDGLFLFIIGLGIAEKYKAAYQKIEIAEECITVMG